MRRNLRRSDLGPLRLRFRQHTMNREGLSKIRRAELLARLAALDAQIEAQRNRAKYVRDMGWNAKLSDERLKVLEDSRHLYLSALKHLLGDEALERREMTDRTGPPHSSSTGGPLDGG